MEKTVFNNRFDISNNSILRLIKHLFLNRLSVVGNIFGNPGLRYLLVLVVLHYFGKPFYWMVTRWERPIRFIINRIKQFK